MAVIGEMRQLTIGGKTYTIPTYSLPIASSSVLGGIKVGSGLSIDPSTGTLTATGTSITIDTAMSDSSTNAVQNKVIKSYADGLIAALDGGTIGTPGAGKTLTALSQTNGQVSATFSNISITKSQVSDFPTNVSSFTNDAGYTTNTGTVTSVRVQATSPVQSSTSTAQSATLNTTISLADAYGDTKNPYGSKTKNYVLAAPSNAAGAPSFRALVAADIPDLSSIYLTSYTETDPTVPAWAKASSKPTYTASEVGALPDSTVIPTKVSELTNDSGYITSYTDEKLKWTASTSSNTYYPLQSTSTATTSTANTLNSVSFYQYYNTAGGYRRFILGNTTAYTSTGGAYGTIRLYGTGATYYGDLNPGTIGANSLTANRTWTLPNATGTIALTTDIPTVPTNVSAFTNDAGYLTSYTETDPTVPSWAKASSKPSYTASEVGAAASDHVHGNITNGGDITATAPTIANGDQIVINDASASKITNGPTFDGSTTTKALTPKGTWVTFLQSFTESDPVFSASAAAGITSSDITNWNNKSDTDEKLQIQAITSGTTYYPIVATNSTTAAVRQYDSNGFSYIGTNGNLSITGTSKLTLGNNVASGTLNNKQGQIILYGSSSYATTITPGGPTAARTITLPNASGTVALTTDIPTVPTNISAFTNDAGYITSYTETDPVFTASAAYGINSSDITNWNNKSDTDEKVKQESLNGINNGRNILLTPSLGTTNTITSSVTYARYMTYNDYAQQLTITKSDDSTKQVIVSGTIVSIKDGTYSTAIRANTPTAYRNIYLPDNNGTFALTSDIPSNISSFTNDAGYITSSTTTKIFTQTSAPTSGMIAGDIWIDTSNLS